MVKCPKCLCDHDGPYQNTTGGKKYWCFDCHKKHNERGTPAYAFAYEWFKSVGLVPRMRQNTLDLIELMTRAYETKFGTKWPMPLCHNRTFKTTTWTRATGIVERQRGRNRTSFVYPRSFSNTAPFTAQSTEDEVFSRLQVEHPYPRIVVPQTKNRSVALGYDFAIYLDGNLLEINEAKTDPTPFTPREVQTIRECEKLGIPYYLNTRKKRLRVFPYMLQATGQMELAGKMI